MPHPSCNSSLASPDQPAWSTAHEAVDLPPGGTARLLVEQLSRRDREELCSYASALLDRAWRSSHAEPERERAREPQDVVSETLLAFLSGEVRFEDPAKFRPLLWAVLRNKCSKLLRQRAQRRTDAGLDLEMAEDPSPSPLEAAAEDEERDRLARYVRTICTIGEADAIIRVDLDGFTPRGAASQLGKQVTTIRAQLSYGRARLRTHLAGGPTCSRPPRPLSDNLTRAPLPQAVQIRPRNAQSNRSSMGSPQSVVGPDTDD
jgi:RNA polymerase sigma factor (sigma-70 family)